MLQKLVKEGGVVRKMHAQQEGGETVLCVGGLQVTGMLEEIDYVLLDSDKVCAV